MSGNIQKKIISKFINGCQYHIFNCGVEKRKIFSGREDYLRFMISMEAFNCQNPIGSLYEKYLREKKRGGSTSIMEVEPPRSEIVEIIAYCLNPNHFHLILQQKKDKGVSKFMQKILTGYTMYFNKKYSRSGVLFQGKFKSVQVESNEQLLYLSAYVSRNNFIHGYSKKDDWEFCSLNHYLGKKKDKLCNSDLILSQFDYNFKNYEKFCKMISGYSKERKEFSRYHLE